MLYVYAGIIIWRVTHGMQTIQNKAGLFQEL